MTFIIATALTWAGQTGTMVLQTDGPIPQESAAAVAWHAFKTTTGHDLTLLPNTSRPTHPVGTHHLDIEVRWNPCSVRFQGLSALTRCPNVRAIQYAWNGHELTYQQTLRSWAQPSPLRVNGQWMISPEQALQLALVEIAEDAAEPVWQQHRQDLLVPVAVYVDDAWRDKHGASWKQEASRRVRSAAGLLNGAQLDLDLIAISSWSPTTETDDLSDLLADLHQHHGPQSTIAIGLTGRVVHSLSVAPEVVGRAYLPGNVVIAACQEPTEGQHELWPGIEEGVTIAHELLHALGVPHADMPLYLMSEHKRTSVRMLHPQTTALAKASAEARFAHWSPLIAAESLAVAANRWLPPNQRLTYVRDNLLAGPDLPQSVPSTSQLSPLASVALAAALVSTADHPEDPRLAIARELHSAAVTAAPEHAESWIDAIGPTGSVWLKGVPGEPTLP